MTEKFFVTTPIYYVNDVPHIGHAYTTIAADILARRSRLIGKEVFFLTGTDEHGQKVEKAAAEKGRTPEEHSDIMVENFKQLWKKLNISNDAFIRTTEKEHVKIVQELLQMLRDGGKIIEREYSGWYCTPDERFWTEKELVEGCCPDCGRPVEQIQEKNYFFLMSEYQNKLVDYIEGSQSYILPETRRNEVLGFLRNNELGDLCISRPRSRLSWGIELPFDRNFVTYVWFDALVNYYSATRYKAPPRNTPPIPPLNKGGSEGGWWPADHHLIGKDILTTHAVYWSTMLMALDEVQKLKYPDSSRFSLPRNIFAHGWWTVEGRKMSKSLGNVVDPNAMIDKYGTDAFRYFLFREVPFGLDGNFSEEALIRRINIDLANDLGNLLSRFLTMSEKYFEGIIERPRSYTFATNERQREIAYDKLKLPPGTLDGFAEECADFNILARSAKLWNELDFYIILDNISEIVSLANNHIASKEPWKLAKENEVEKLKGVMFDVWNALRLIALSLYPFMPETAEKIWKQLGLESLINETEQSRAEKKADDERFYAGIFYWDWLPTYQIKVSKGEQLFPRIETERKKKMETISNPNIQETEKKTADNFISIEDFAKVELKIGRVVSAERVAKSDKLIKLKVDIGEERQVVAGIGKAYTPEYLVGKEVVIVANLQPAKLMGVESRGMLLAATDDEGKPSILILDREVKPGSRVK